MGQVVNSPPLPTPARALTASEGSQLRSQPTMSTPSLQTSQTTNVTFKPLQMLMQTPVSVEYGENLKETLTMHEEILRCHSPMFEHRCAKAKPLSEQYVKSKALSDQVAKCVFPEVTAEQFDKHRLSEKVAPVILDIYSAYPLAEYLTSVQETIDTAIQEEMGRKNTKVKERKEPKDSNRDMTANGRLPLLNSQGVQHVAEKLFTKLLRISKADRIKAKSDVVKAAAQHRILLPNVNEKTIQAFIDWIYRGTIQCPDAEQLYALLDLSLQMGTKALTELCVSNLHNAASECIRQASANGLCVEALVSPDSSPSNVVAVVFGHVIKSERPPKRLLQLVLDTIACSLNKGLWAQLRGSMTYPMTLQLIDSIIALKSVKSEEGDQMGVKRERDE